MNLANKLTLLRFFLIPFFVVFMLIPEIPYNYLWAGIVFALASITDFLDGQVARRKNMITDLGKFLDPLADKALVVAALICFVELGFTYSWLVIVIVLREFAVSGVRLAAASGENKTVIAAGLLGKLKTASTMVSICVILFLQILAQFGTVVPYTNVINDILIYISAALTLVSGIQYLWQYRGVFKQ